MSSGLCAVAVRMCGAAQDLNASQHCPLNGHWWLTSAGVERLKRGEAALSCLSTCAWGFGEKSLRGRAAWASVFPVPEKRDVGELESSHSG